MATQAPRLVGSSGIRMARPQKVARDIVVIDGISRSGKSLVCPLLGTLERGELWLTDHLFEYLCAMDHLKRIRPDAAEMLARLYADFDLYNLQIGRYTNLRPTDITGAAENLLAKRYQDRLLEKDGDRIIDKIKKQRPFLFLMTHYVFDTSRVLFDSFGPDLKMYLLTTRHPIWLVESWHEGQWDRRMGADPREFQLVCRAHGKTVPWFAAKWAKRYLSLNSLEKSIEIVAYFSRAFDRRYRTMDATQKKKVFILPYEDFSTDPDRYLGILCGKLGTRSTKLTRSMLKRMGFPRSFSWAELERKKELMEHQMQRSGVRASTRSLFRELCSDYEKEHDLQGLRGQRT